MPKIPGLSYEGRAPGAIPGGANIVSPAQDNTGAALAQLGAKLTDLSSGLLDIYQETQARNESSLAQQELQDTMMRLRYGGKNADGKDEPPPSPDKHDAIFSQQVESIKERASRNLNGKSLRMFDSSFNEYANRASLQVKTQANELMQDEISAKMDETLLRQANAYVAEGPLGKKIIRDQAFADIDRTVSRGVWKAQEGLARKTRFIDDTAKGSAMKMMQPEGGPEMLIAAIDGGEFNDLPADTKERLRKEAFEESDRRIRRKISDLQREEMKALRDERLLQEKTAVEGLALHGKGELTPGWVQANIRKLGFDKGKTLMKIASGQEDLIINNEKLADVMQRAFEGRDVADEAWKGVGRFWGPTEMKDILRITADRSPYIKGQNVFDEGMNMLEGLLSPNAEMKDPSLRAKVTKAKRDFMLWFNDEQQRQLPREELVTKAREYYEQLVDKSLNFDPSKEIFGARMPKYYNGERFQITVEALDKAAKETQRAFEAKEISEREFRDEVIRIKDLKKAAERKQQRTKSRETK